MKYKWIKRTGSRTLIAFFGGFACDGNILSRSGIPGDCDTALFFDYRGLDTDFDFGAYKKIAVIAWSFGVWVADFLAEKTGKAFMRIAINGSPYPVDDLRGIPEQAFERTLARFDASVRDKFFRRVCGGASEFSESGGLLASRDPGELAEELAFLKSAFKLRPGSPEAWDVFIASRSDRIFPLENLKRAWGDGLRVCEGDHLNVPIFGVALSAVSRRISKMRGGFEKSAGESYSRHAFVQREIASTLADIIEDFAPEPASVKNILEIGCGTGFLTSELASKFGSAQWHLNDISPKMCELAAKNLPEDAARVFAENAMSAEFPKNMDLILSSSCFQWLDDLPSLFKKLSAISKSGAILAFSTFGDRNFFQIRSITGSGLKYPPLGAVKSALADAGYSVLYAAEDIMDVEFGSPRAVLEHMKSTGVNGGFSRFWTPKKLADFSASYACGFSSGGGVVLTYNPIYIIAKKTS